MGPYIYNNLKYSPGFDFDKFPPSLQYLEVDPDGGAAEGGVEILQKTVCSLRAVAPVCQSGSPILPEGNRSRCILAGVSGMSPEWQILY
jgi:hypothetical protein